MKKWKFIYIQFIIMIKLLTARMEKLSVKKTLLTQMQFKRDPKVQANSWVFVNILPSIFGNHQ
jgi:hypothetical protein